MRPLYVSIILQISIFQISLPAFAASPPAEFFARTIVDQLISIQHSDAQETLAQLQTHHPDYPLTGFYRAAAIWATAQDQDHKNHEELQQKSVNALQASIQQARKALNQSSINERDRREWQLSLGMSKIFIARIYLQQSRWIKAYRHIRKGRDQLKQLLSQDPSYTDAWFTLGLYEYYTGSVPDHLKWLTRIIDLSGDRKKGIEYIIRSIKTAPIASPEAARVLLDEIKPLNCGNLGLAKQMRSRYTENPQFHIIVQRLQVYCGYPEKALKQIKALAKSHPKHFHKFAFGFNELTLAAFASLGQTEKISQFTPNKKFPDTLRQFYLAKGFDVAKQRTQAVAIYRSIMDDPELKPWQQEHVARYLENPYVPPKPRINIDNGLRITPLSKP